jgi:hypothetical protein
MRRTLGLGLVIAIALGGCGGGGAEPPDAGGPPDHPLVEVPASTTPEPGIRRDLVRVPGAQPVANPTTGQATPAELNATHVLRYRPDVEPAPPADAIVIALPGFLAGGGSYDALARALVRRGIAAGRVLEVWAIDRRANQLEDLRGADTAEAVGDPEIAWQYYNGLATVGGTGFAGFHPAADVSYMSEWGLATHVDDVRAVLALVPAAARRGHVVLLGHSLSGSFVEAFAAWRFTDGTRGAEQVAGLVLIDGVLADAPIDEAMYLAGAGGGLGATPGLTDIRADAAFFELPILGQAVFPMIEVLSLRALLAPEAVVADSVRDDTMRVLLLLGESGVPAMTNAAALGFGFDDESCPLAFAGVSVGASRGGPLAPFTSPFGGGELVHPSDPAATYAWTDAAAAAPPEPTPLANLAHSFVDGRTNFAEWYFPNRLRLDLAAAGGARLSESGWQAQAGLRVFDGALVDAPILAISSGFLEPADYEALRARVAPAVGAGRPNAGATRADPAGFATLEAAGLTHTDPLVADDGPGNPVPAAVEAFVWANVEPGTVAISSLP